MKHLLRLSSIFILLCICSGLHGQKSPDYSGTWVQDTTKGDFKLPGLTLVLTIVQKGDSISLKMAYVNNAGKEEDSMKYRLTLNGKEVSRKESGWIESYSATISSDKALTIKTTQTMPDQVVEAYEIYSILDNGKALVEKAFNVEAKDHPYFTYFKKK